MKNFDYLNDDDINQWMYESINQLIGLDETKVKTSNKIDRPFTNDDILDTMLFIQSL